MDDKLVSETIAKRTGLLPVCADKLPDADATSVARAIRQRVLTRHPTILDAIDPLRFS